MKNCIAMIQDKKTKINWVYEGTIQGTAIFVPEEKAKPELITETDAYIIALANAEKHQKPKIKKIN